MKSDGEAIEASTDQLPVNIYEKNKNKIHVGIKKIKMNVFPVLNYNLAVVC